MPRKNRRAPDEAPQPCAHAAVGGADVGARARASTSGGSASDKPYRCPGCDLEVRPGVWHLVVVPQDDPDERRHWHEGCWRIELNRTRGRRRDV